MAPPWGSPPAKQRCWVPQDTAELLCKERWQIPPKAAGRDAGSELELRCTPPRGLPGSPSPAALTLHPTSAATSLNTYSFKDYSNVAHF